MSRIFHIDCELDYDVATQTVFVFNIGVHDRPGQRTLAETRTVQPELPVDEFRDATTANRFFRTDAAPGAFTMRYLAAVEIEEPAVDLDAPETPVAQVPGDVFPYLRPSRYCESDQIFALACSQFGQMKPGYTRVQAICQWIRDNIKYQIGTSTPMTTAQHVLENKAGVCRDFAHLSIAFCRALNIPARFVTAYARYQEPPPDFHAVFQAYLGDRWYLFDPTELSLLDEIVPIGIGVDASEVPFATFFGSAKLRRLSPLIEPKGDPAAADAKLVPLQSADSGIVLAA